MPGPGGELRPNPEAVPPRRPGHDAGARHAAGRPRSRLFTPRRVELVELLAEQAMLPAIDFIFSRAACDDAVKQCLAAGLRLTTTRRAPRAAPHRGGADERR